MKHREFGQKTIHIPAGTKRRERVFALHGRLVRPGVQGGRVRVRVLPGRALHSSASQLNLSRL